MNNMFVARFEQVTNSEKFEADKRGNLPFIGTLLAGRAKSSLLNGTVFINQGYKVGQMYLCENYVDPNFPVSETTGETIHQVRIITEVSALEFMSLRKELGQGTLVRTESNGATQDSTPVAEANTVTAEDVV